MEKTYSPEKEILYYRSKAEDRRAIPFEHLGAYVKGSFGLEFFRDKTVLDLGCGEGIYSAWIADAGGASKVLGVDLTEHRLRRDYELKLPNLRLVAEDLFGFEPPEMFDVVFMNLVLHHLRFRLDDAIDLIYRSLKPGGRFAAIEPNFYSPAAILLHSLHDTSANEGFISPRRIRKGMLSRGFSNVESGYFWRDRPWAKNPFLASCVWVTARK